MTSQIEFEDFARLIQNRLLLNEPMPNPGKGSSAVIKWDEDRVCYKRGRSRFYVKFQDLYDAYRRFAGQAITTNDLKRMKPSVFDSKRNGHSCHCTFFFMSLKRMGIVNKISGTGRSGNPFGVSIPLSK